MTTTPIQRASLCAAVASINLPHISFWCEQQGCDPEPYRKLLSKVLSFLRGELKSEANLLRFHESFSEWRLAQDEEDSLSYRILEASCAALYSATETLFDAECDDIDLLCQSLAAIYDEMDELGAETADLREYWQSLQSEWRDMITESSRIPLPKAFFMWLKEADVSLFGLAE
ncbi:MAG: hypothetical protein LRY72_18205 [Saccharospirillaceae bacterium]|nr:hypothetical protein [Saccharospirillaceae bacterium]